MIIGFEVNLDVLPTVWYQLRNVEAYKKNAAFRERIADSVVEGLPDECEIAKHNAERYLDFPLTTQNVYRGFCCTGKSFIAKKGGRVGHGCWSGN